MAQATKVRVLWRDVPLADEATLETTERGIFVAIGEPVPVRSVLQVEADGETRNLQVVRVVEVASSDPQGVRGLYARDVEADQAPAGVGSEHLEPAPEGSAPAPESDSEEPPEAASDEHGTPEAGEAQGDPDTTAAHAGTGEDSPDAGADTAAGDDGAPADDGTQNTSADPPDGGGEEETADDTPDGEPAAAEGVQPSLVIPPDGGASHADPEAEDAGSKKKKGRKRKGRKRG